MLTTKVDNKTYHKSNKEIETREEKTPICESQNFIPPKSLTKQELVVWEELVKILKSVQGSYISDADVMTMEIYCKAKVEYDNACKRWDKNPTMYVQIATGGIDRDGEPKTALKLNPDYQMKRDFSNIMLKYLHELGISPTGRAKQGIQATKSKMQNDREELLEIFNRSDD